VLLERPRLQDKEAGRELIRLAWNRNQMTRQLNSLDPSLLADMAQIKVSVLEVKALVEELQDVFLVELSEEVLRKLHGRVSAALEASE